MMTRLYSSENTTRMSDKAETCLRMMMGGNARRKVDGLIDCGSCSL
jgi:hypothetical protein